MALDDVVLLNVDTNTLETPYDDLQSLPNDVVRNSWLFRDQKGITKKSPLLDKMLIILWKAIIKFVLMSVTF